MDLLFQCKGLMKLSGDVCSCLSVYNEGKAYTYMYAMYTHAHVRMYALHALEVLPVLLQVKTVKSQPHACTMVVMSMYATQPISCTYVLLHLRKNPFAAKKLKLLSLKLRTRIQSLCVGACACRKWDTVP